MSESSLSNLKTNTSNTETAGEEFKTEINTSNFMYINVKEEDIHFDNKNLGINESLKYEEEFENNMNFVTVKNEFANNDLSELGQNFKFDYSTINDTVYMQNEVANFQTETNNEEIPCFEYHKPINEKEGIYIAPKKPFACTLCGYRTGSQHFLDVHLKLHKSKKCYTCEQCNYKTRDKSQLKEHMRRHFGDKTFKCDFCDYKSVSKKGLNGHMQTHSGEKPFSCTFCNYKTNCKTTLVGHIRVHTAEKPFVCTICQYKATTQQRLRIHMRVHTGEKPYKCTTCGCTFAMRTSLLYHMRIHNPNKPFHCTFCGSKFRHKFHLTRHLKIHIAGTYFPCHLCPYKTYKESILIKHITKIHENPAADKVKIKESASLIKNFVKVHENPVSAIEVKSETEEKMYECNKCNYSSFNKEYFRQHVKRHLRVKNICCSLCLYKTDKQAALDYHIKKSHPEYVAQNTFLDTDNVSVETDLEIFSCDACNYKSSNKKSYNRHRKLHVNKEIFSCDLCQYRTSKEILLNNHVKKIHENDEDDAKINKPQKIFNCDLCSYKTNRNSVLIGHLRRHAGIKPISCNLCEYKTDRKSALKNHIQKCHPDVEIKSEIQFSKQPKFFNCNLCEYKTIYKTHLTRHSKVHTGQMPLNWGKKRLLCNICGFKCDRKLTLNNHLIKVHTVNVEISDKAKVEIKNDIKYYNCDLCQYKTTYKSHLTRHIRIHTGEKRFTCSLCEFKTDRGSRLKYHVDKFHLSMLRLTTATSRSSEDANCKNLV